jgi:hypothetical protein
MMPRPLTAPLSPVETLSLPLGDVDEKQGAA